MREVFVQERQLNLVSIIAMKPQSRDDSGKRAMTNVTGVLA